MRVQTSLNIQNKKSIPLERGDPGVENVYNESQNILLLRERCYVLQSASKDKPQLRGRVQTSKYSDLKIITKNSNKENKPKQIYNTRSVYINIHINIQNTFVNITQYDYK